MKWKQKFILVLTIEVNLHKKKKVIDQGDWVTL